MRLSLKNLINITLTYISFIKTLLNERFDNFIYKLNSKQT